LWSGALLYTAWPARADTARAAGSPTLPSLLGQRWALLIISELRSIIEIGGDERAATRLIRLLAGF